MSDPLADILTDVNNTNTLVDMRMADNGNEMAQVMANNDAINQSYAASNARQQLVVGQTQVIEDTKNQGALVAQTAKQQYAHSVGIDYDGTLSAQQAQAQQTFLDASSRAAQSAQVIAQKRSVSFFDDPLQWLSNKLTINDDINAFNGAAGEANTAEQFIQDSNALVDQRAIALTAVQQVTSQAAAEAATNKVVEQQQELADQMKRAGIAANTQGVETVANMDWRNIQLMNMKTDAESKLLGAQTSQEHLQLAQQQFDLEKARLALAQAKENEKDGADQYMHDQLVKGMQLMFPNNPAAWNIPDGKYKAMIAGKLPLDPVWKKAFDVAQSTDIAGGQGTRILGTSPADAISALSFKPTIAPTAQPTVDLLNRALATASNSPAYKQALAAKDQKAATDIVNATVDQMVKADASHVDSPTSLYYLPPIDKIAESIPGTQDSPFFKTIVAPAAAAGIDMSNPGQVAKQAVQAIKDGKISLNEAANNMSAMYGIGQQWNFQAKQMFSLGITAAPSYTTNVTGLTPVGYGNFGTVDWTNEIQVKELFMRMSAANQAIAENPRPFLVGHTR